MKNKATAVMIALGATVAVVAAMRATGSAQNPGAQGAPGLCTAQQSCPPQPVGVLEIADYGDSSTPIFGFSFEVTNPGGTAGGGGGGAGKAEFSDFGVTRITDAISARLLLDAATGRHLKLVNIVLKRGDTTDALYRLSDVTIARVHSGPELEEVAFTYSRIEFTVGGRAVCFDLTTNSSC